MDRAFLLCDGEVVGAEHLPVDKMGPVHAPPPPKARRATAPAPECPTPAAGGAGALRDELEALEHQRILDALASCGGNQSQAAKLLGLSRGALLARLERYNLPRPRKR
jgi:DNA-binding NtrC family response regulator